MHDNVVEECGFPWDHKLFIFFILREELFCFEGVSLYVYFNALPDTVAFRSYAKKHLSDTECTTFRS